MQNTRQIFAENLNIRLSQINTSDFSRKIGISRQVVYRYLKGEIPRIENLEAIASELKCEVYQLFSKFSETNTCDYLTSENEALKEQIKDLEKDLDDKHRRDDEEVDSLIASIERLDGELSKAYSEILSQTQLKTIIANLQKEVAELKEVNK